MLTMLAAAAAAAPSMPATDAATKAAITAYIVRCEEVWAKSGMSDRSREASAFVADDYRGVSSRGKVRHKADVIGFEPLADKGAALYYATVRFYTPTVAIAQGEEWDEPGDGAGKRHKIWIDTWLLRGGRWQIVASQDAVVPLDQPLQKDVP